jgi:histidinol-phosphatase (PHP family)
MLTDYHLHLRPDDAGATPAEYFTPANFERYRQAASDRGIEELGVSEHIYRFHQALEVWRHPFWERFASDDVDDYCRFVREETDLRLGIEADFVPGAEDRLAALLEARDFDYVVGSVHFITDGAVDMDDFTVWDPKDPRRSPEAIWERYFETVAASARSGLFDIVSHPDLVKYWGPAHPERVPRKDPRFYYEPTVEAFIDSGVAVELSTAGLRKPVGEMYPAPAFLQMCVEAQVPIALSSDAHRPQDVGAGYEQAIEALRELGVERISVFERRERRLEPLGDLPGSGEEQD